MGWDWRASTSGIEPVRPQPSASHCASIERRRTSFACSPKSAKAVRIDHRHAGNTVLLDNVLGADTSATLKGSRRAARPPRPASEILILALREIPCGLCEDYFLFAAATH